jgi:hypothetical protein
VQNPPSPTRRSQMGSITKNWGFIVQELEYCPI